VVEVKNQDFGRGGAGFPAGMKWSFMIKNQENHVIGFNAEI
jgi:NADH:ubiquinone oxidoreductase subunit F (NADH-binding)